MSDHLNGNLIPTGGGDSIPLVRPVLTIGRRDSCDIRLPFANVSGVHAELRFQEGAWSIRDMNSTNGTKVNEHRVVEQRLRPGDEIAIGSRRYKIEYRPASGASVDTSFEEVRSMSLLEKAGLVRPRHDSGRSPRQAKGW